MLRGPWVPLGTPLANRSVVQPYQRHPEPNQGVQLTAYSVRSSVAPASSGG
jgi:hypothetical protein